MTLLTNREKSDIIKNAHERYFNVILKYSSQIALRENGLQEKGKVKAR